VDSHFCASTHARVRDGVPELLVIMYREPDGLGGYRPARIKFAGGMGEEGESLHDTALAEAIEELGGEDFQIYSVEQVSKASQRDHTKNFFSIKFDGRLREGAMLEDDGTKIFPPLYVDVRELHSSLLFAPSHRLALDEFILFFSQQFEEFAWVGWELELEPRHSLV
jgi:8-oxo-dGTP pyrophosphatase MutT (NUDIX family)